MSYAIKQSKAILSSKLTYGCRGNSQLGHGQDVRHHCYVRLLLCPNKFLHHIPCEMGILSVQSCLLVIDFLRTDC